MKKIIFCLLLLNAGYADAQIDGVRALPLDVTLRLNAMEYAAKYADVEGSPFLANDYKKAYVRIKGGQSFLAVPVKFNVLNNEIWFKQKDAEMILLKTDSIAYLNNPDDTFSVVALKTGYPDIGANTGSSLYQVLADGNVQLLKYYKCNLIEIKDMNVVVGRKFEIVPEYYVFSNGSLKKIKNSKKSFKEVLPALESKIDAAFKTLTELTPEIDMIYIVNQINK